MIYIILGVVSGIATGVGIGGGTLLIIILTTLFGINQKVAQSCNLIFFIPTAIISILANIKNKNINILESIPLIIIGSIAGLFSGLLASGGGLIIVPMLVLIYKMSEKESRAETIFCIFPMVITSMIIYGKTQFVNWNIGILCGIGGALGGFIGSKLLNKINDKYLIIIFIIFTIYSAVMMLIK